MEITSDTTRDGYFIINSAKIALESVVKRFPKRLDFFLCFILVTTALTFCYSVSHLSSRVLQSYHGLPHAALAYQLFNGLFPPTNPVVAEALPANYWAFHALVALCMHLINLTPFEVISLFNCCALAICVTSVYCISRQIRQTPFVATITAISTLVLTGPIWYGTLFLKSLEISVLNLNYIAGYKAIFGTSFDLRGVYFIDKFFNQSSWPSAIALFSVLTYCLLISPAKNRSWCFQVTVFLICLLLGMFNPIALFSLNFLAISFAITDYLYLNKDGNSLSWKLTWLVTILYRNFPQIFANLLMLPYIAVVSESHKGGVNIRTGVDEIIQRVIASGESFWILLFISVFGTWFSFRDKIQYGKTLSLWIVFLLIAAIFLELPRGNEYKIVLTASIPAALVLGILLGRLSSRLIPALVIIISILFILGVSRQRIQSEWAGHEPFLFNGTVTSLASEKERKVSLQMACNWIQSNTPTNSYIATKPRKRNKILVPVLGERRVLVGLPDNHNMAVKHYKRIFQLNDTLVLTASQQDNMQLSNHHPLAKEILSLIGNTQPIYVLSEVNNKNNLKYQPREGYLGQYYSVMPVYIIEDSPKH